MPIQVDLSEAKDFEVVPVGTYECVVTDAEEKEGSKGAYVALTLTIDGSGEQDNRKLFTNLSFTPQSASFLKRGLVALGWQPEDLVGTFELDINDFIGAKCRAQVKHEDYEGETKARVAKIERSERTVVKKLGAKAPAAKGRARR